MIISKSRAATRAVFFLMPFVSVVPQNTPILSAMFIFAVVGMVFNAATSRKCTGNAAFKPAAAFLLIVLLSFPVALMHEVSARDWFVRGALPYCFFFLVLFSVPTNNPRFLIRTLVLSCSIWAAYVLLQLVVSDFNNVMRFTFITRDLLLPYNLVAIPLLLFYNQYFSKKEQMAGLIVMIVLTFAAGYRSHIVLVVAILAVYFFYSRGWQRIYMSGFLVLFAAVFGGYFLATPAGEQLIHRISFEITEDFGRIAEMRFALEKFYSSPILGVGLGTPVPPDVTFAGREAYMDGLLSLHGHDYYVTYMHNIVFYTLMSMGSVGLLVYGSIFWRVSFNRKRPMLTERVGVVLALGSIGAFTLVAATFTLLQWQVMVAALTALLGSRRWVVGKTGSDAS